MIDRGMTADLLEEHLEQIEKHMPGYQALPGAIRSAIRHLRADDTNKPYTRQEVEAFADTMKTGAVISCYMETKGYFKPEGCIVYAVQGYNVFVTESGGINGSYKLEEYGRTWRLWPEYPSGHARVASEWEA